MNFTLNFFTFIICIWVVMVIGIITIMVCRTLKLQDFPLSYSKGSFSQFVGLSRASIRMARRFFNLWFAESSTSISKIKFKTETHFSLVNSVKYLSHVSHSQNMLLSPKKFFP